MTRYFDHIAKFSDLLDEYVDLKMTDPYSLNSVDRMEWAERINELRNEMDLRIGSAPDV